MSLAPVLFKLLTSNYNNWMLIKIIKLFGALTTEEPRLPKKLVEPLSNLINTTPAMSLIYECIQTCTIGMSEHLPIIKAIRRCPRGDTECIEMLLDRGADINKMYRGWNAILQAVESGNIKILKVLLEKGNELDLEVVDEDGKTVRESVIERGWAEAIPLLFPRPRS